MSCFEILDENDFVNFNLDFPIEISHEEPDLDVRKELRSIRKISKHLVKEKELILGCEVTDVVDKCSNCTYPTHLYVLVC